MRRERGIALLLVMWLTMLLAAVVGTFALTAPMEKLQGRTLSRGVVADHAPRAGVEYALTLLTDTDPQRHRLPDGRRYDWAVGALRVRREAVEASGTAGAQATALDT